MLDILFVNGKYPDFVSGEIKAGNVGVKDGKIAYIGAETPEAAEVVDVAGHIVSPGFIDIHMHEDDFAAEGEQYIISQMMLEMGVTTAVGGNCGIQKQPLKYFKEVIEKLGGAPVNYLMQTGYNTHRGNIGAVSRATTQEERDKIRKVIQEELAEGACGISFGIEYDPSISTEEVLYAIGATDDPRRIISAHSRSGCNTDIAAITEMIEIAEQIPMKFQMSHLSSVAAMGLMKECLEAINEAIEKNPRLSYDTYPYNAYSSFIGSEAFNEEDFKSWGMDYSDILLTDEPYKDMRCDKELFDKVRAEYPNMLAVGFAMKEPEIAMAIANKYGMVASDAIINNAKGHPRAAGTFPRVLGKYVREDGVLPLIDALRKMTLEPAKVIGLDNKGRIEVGCDADLTIFNPDTIIDGATYADLGIQPEGIKLVYIGGEKALEDKVTVNNRLGRFIGF